VLDLQMPFKRAHFAWCSVLMRDASEPYATDALTKAEIYGRLGC
jgi:hypothetical protein